MPTWPNRPAEFYLAALDDPDPHVRQQACAALEVMREARAVEPLLALLAGDENASMRGNAARALGRLGDSRANAQLVLALRDLAPDVRQQAVCALQALGDLSAAPAIAALLQDPDGNVRYFATTALGKLGAADVITPLMARLREDGDQVDPTVSAALARIGAPAREPLLAALRDERATVRARAAAALMTFNGQRVVAALTSARHDPDAYVRHMAKMTLDQIKTRRMLARVERLKAEGKLGMWNILDFLAHRNAYEDEDHADDD